MKSVVSVFCSDSENNWNKSDEEKEDSFGDDPLHVGRLCMELDKMVDKSDVLNQLYIIVAKATMMMAKIMRKTVARKIEETAEKIATKIVKRLKMI